MTSPDITIPYGFCQCGCGGKTNVVTEDCRWSDEVVGESRKFLPNHRRILPNRVTFSVMDGHEVAFIHLDGKESHAAIVLNIDLRLVIGYRWRRGTNGYAVTTMPGEKSNTQMHSLIMTCPAGMMLDHRNRRRLDNRTTNLRPATQAQQEYNKAPSSRNTSGFKGVHWSRACNGWAATIMTRSRKMWLGSFAVKEAAARAYDAAAVIHQGEFAWLNFPEEHGLPPRP